MESVKLCEQELYYASKMIESLGGTPIVLSAEFVNVKF